MPAAAVTAVGVLGGGLLQRSSQNHATDAQRRANDQAMAYQRQKDGQLRTDKWNQYQQHVKEYGAWLQTYKPDYYDNWKNSVMTAPPGGSAPVPDADGVYHMPKGAADQPGFYGPGAPGAPVVRKLSPVERDRGPLPAPVVPPTGAPVPVVPGAPAADVPVPVAPMPGAPQMAAMGGGTFGEMLGPPGGGPVGPDAAVPIEDPLSFKNVNRWQDWKRYGVTA